MMLLLRRSSTAVTLLLSSLVASAAAFSPLSLQRRIHQQQHQSSRAAFGLLDEPGRRRHDGVLYMANVGVFFGTSTGSTESVADLIAEEFGGDVDGPFEIDVIQGKIADTFSKYDALIVGTPTWNTGADTERSGTGWDEIYYGEMQDLNIAGKKVAVFGLGDSVSYAENYADASGELHDVFESLGCKMIGYVSQEGYEHEDSKAIRGDLFCGLLLDAVNQEELTEGRVQNWVAQLKSEGILEGDGAAGAPVETTPEPAVVVEAVPVAAADMPPAAVATTNDVEAAALSQLEKENAQLRQLLEENSRMLDETISDHGSGRGDGYTPHYNSITGKTMWTSPDGHSCYFTVDARKTTNFSP